MAETEIHRNPRVAVLRQGRWKLLVRRMGAPEDRFALFDVDADPDERHDLVRERPDVVALILREYHADRHGVDDEDSTGTRELG